MYSSNYLCKIVIATLLIFIFVQGNPNWGKVEMFLQRNLNYGVIASVFICFTSTNNTLENTKANTITMSRKIVAGHLQFALKQLSEDSQKDVIKVLEDYKKYKIVHESIWLTNRIYIENLNLEVANQIIDDPNLLYIQHADHFHLLQNNIKDVVIHQDNEKFTWGLQKIQAEEAWKSLGGAENAGTGAIVGIMDTGFDIEQDLINGSALDEFGWFDPTNGSRDKPVDWNGHGTHVTGIIVGKKGIGVAPGAKFISCRACDNQYGCSRIHIEKCAQNFVCPNSLDGTEDCSKVVDVVNISFGSQNTEKSWFERIIAAFTVVRIVSVVAAGSGGRYCESIYYPASLKDVFTVTSVTKNDAASDFSSWGPIEGKAYLKPDFTAPGSFIKSAGIPRWLYYSYLSGTSMAAAHVTGLVALIRAKNPELGIEQIREVIKNNCDDITIPRYNIKCNDTTDEKLPNYMHGYGRINAFKTVSAL